MKEGNNMMKAIVSGKVKVQISLPGGEVTVNLDNGKVHQGALTNEELSQLAFRVTEVTKGTDVTKQPDVTFDPPGENLIGRHLSDVKTIERQTSAIEGMRTKLTDLEKKVNLPSVELQTKVTQLEKDLQQANVDKETLTKELATMAADLKAARDKYRDMREAAGVKENVTPEANPPTVSQPAE